MWRKLHVCLYFVILATNVKNRIDKLNKTNKLKDHMDLIIVKLNLEIFALSMCKSMCIKVLYFISFIFLSLYV